MDFTDNLCYILYVAQPRMEKYPSWLKGLPWKGSRSLVAARGFKSLLLRRQKRDPALQDLLFCLIRELVSERRNGASPEHLGGGELKAKPASYVRGMPGP